MHFDVNTVESVAQATPDWFRKWEYGFDAVPLYSDFSVCISFFASGRIVRHQTPFANVAETIFETPTSSSFIRA